MINHDLIDQYQQNGFVIVSGLFSQEEVQMYIDHYMALNAEGHGEGREIADETDPLKKYPRLMHPHRHDRISMDWMLDKRIVECLEALLGAEPYATQTMVYYKPPGSRGQALHQDQFYLRVQPGTCMAAWMALDRCDEENGCLQIVPGSGNLPVLCSAQADLSKSFSPDTVYVPEGMGTVPVILEPGDVLFFNGCVIHGSFPNTSETRFRRALIGHYVSGEAEKVAQWYNPVWMMDGTQLDLENSKWGGSCGVWVNKDGTPVVEMAGVETRQNYEIH
jgi:phytanoyl-CoA hydroxylase